MNIEFDKEYLQDLYFKGKQVTRNIDINQKLYVAIKKQ